MGFRGWDWRLHLGRLVRPEREQDPSGAVDPTPFRPARIAAEALSGLLRLIEFATQGVWAHRRLRVMDERRAEVAERTHPAPYGLADRASVRYRTWGVGAALRQQIPKVLARFERCAAAVGLSLVSAATARSTPPQNGKSARASAQALQIQISAGITGESFTACRSR